MTKQIPLSQGKFALVDDADYEWLSQYRWYLSTVGYAARNKSHYEPKPYIAYMAREILGCVPYDGLIVDHIDGDKLNNQRTNLRKCTIAQNIQNQKLRKDNTSGFKGVTKYLNRWKSEIEVFGKKMHIGVFATAIEAAKAYDESAKRLHGEFAFLNFPDS